MASSLLLLMVNLCVCCQPAASSSVGLGAFLLLCLLVELGQDEAVPALDQTTQLSLARLLIRVSEDQAQCRGLWDGSKGSQEVAGLGVGRREG